MARENEKRLTETALHRASPSGAGQQCNFSLRIAYIRQIAGRSSGHILFAPSVFQTLVRSLTMTPTNLVEASLAPVEVPAYFCASWPFAGPLAEFFLNAGMTFQRRSLARAITLVSRVLLASTLLIEFRVTVRLRTGRVMRRRSYNRGRHRAVQARQAEGVPPPVEELRASRTVTGRRVDRSTAIGRQRRGPRRRIARGLPQSLARIAKLESGWFAAGRVQYLAVGRLGTPRRGTGVITGTPGAALLLELVGAPELVEVEGRIGCLRVVLGREFENQRSAGWLGQRLALRRAPLFGDRHLLETRKRRQLSWTPRRFQMDRLSGTVGCHLHCGVSLTNLLSCRRALSLTIQCPEPTVYREKPRSFVIVASQKRPSLILRLRL